MLKSVKRSTPKVVLVCISLLQPSIFFFPQQLGEANTALTLKWLRMGVFQRWNQTILLVYLVYFDGYTLKAVLGVIIDIICNSWKIFYYELKSPINCHLQCRRKLLRTSKYSYQLWNFAYDRRGKPFSLVESHINQSNIFAMSHIKTYPRLPKSHIETSYGHSSH